MSFGTFDGATVLVGKVSPLSFALRGVWLCPQERPGKQPATEAGPSIG